MIRVLVYGGRDFIGGLNHLEWVDYLFADWGPEEITVVSGGARGADRLGEVWAEEIGATLEVFPADWEKHGKAAGHLRNQEMLDSGVDYAVEFPGGRGTADMRRRLDKAGVKVYEYKGGG